MKWALGFIFLSLNAFAVEPLRPEFYLYKISQRLVNDAPTPLEYSRLSEEMRRTGCREVSCLQDYFKFYIRGKLNSGGFLNQAALQVFEKFSFRTPSRPPFYSLASSSPSFPESFDPETYLIYRLFKYNMPIDELFTSQTVWSSDKISDLYRQSWEIDSISEPILAALDFRRHPNLFVPYRTPEEGPAQIFSLNYSGHANVSGMFTGATFLDRYWNTPVNGNRKRAAALYKIMLCDPMAPALERETQAAREENLSHGVSEASADVRTETQVLQSRHASQEDCRKCHIRLDYVARTMRPLELGISSVGISGNLRYFQDSGPMIDVPVDNFHDLVVKATRTKKYADCQLNWFYQWVVGKDVTLPQARFQTLLENFERQGRKVKTVIEELLLSPEFRGEPPPLEPESLTRARAVLTRCTQCHQNFLYSSRENLKSKLSLIVRKLDLTRAPSRPSMPPDWAGWNLSPQELESVRNWIVEGAPLGAGQPNLLSSQESRDLLSPRVNP